MTCEPLEAALNHLQQVATASTTAVAEMLLSSGTQCLLRAGGPGIMSVRERGHWASIEVLLSGDPPRFWNRFSAGEDMSLFTYVPPLLVVNYVTRSGGAVEVDLRVEHRARTGILDVKIAVREGNEHLVQEALEHVIGARVLVSHFSLDERLR